MFRFPAMPPVVACCCVCLAAAAPAHAADAPPGAAGDSVLTLGKVQATSPLAAGSSARSVFSSVDILGGDLLQDQHVDYSWELLMRAPGVQVTQFKMGTDAGRFSFRGFNGEGRINAVKLLIDGVPSNDNAGAMPYLDAVFPLDIAAIEIVRGTNDPRYGLNAIAGSVDVLTRSGGNDGRASVTVGSFGTREVQATQGIERGAWSQNYFAAWRDSDGYRDHADARKHAFAGKWFYTDPDGRWRAGLSARDYRNTALEAGYLDYATAQRAPRSSPDYARDDRSQRHTTQVSLHLDARLAETVQGSAKAYWNRYDNQRWVRFTAAGAQQERDTDERQRGVLARLSWRPALARADAFALEGGVDAQWQDNLSQRYRTVARVRTAPLRDWDFDLHTEGAYVQAVLRPTERLQLVPGYRVDRVGGQFRDLASGARYPAYAYGTIRQPKFSAVYALTAQASLYANIGRTFQIGSGNGAYRTQARNLAPSYNDGWETGLKFAGAQQRWDARVAYWEQRASDEVATILGVNGSVGTGEVGNVGKTLRRGWDAQLNLRPDERWTLWLAYSRQRAVIVTPDPSAPATRGKEIENVPHYLANAGIDWQATPRLTLSAWGNAQGDYYVERSNTLGRYGGYALANLGATWRWRAQREVSLQLKNLTDRHYVYAWYDSGSSGYSPGDGRALYATLSWGW
ncbi:TonB-dependent receptor [uncultured Xanthomonas sp.]|uniref:TonB-dependent receptor n=1 Tax=uncultured Xanthomonas sp. TaxID=152831 RepID=UPI0025D7A50F|nr:TonB-dependent receptor [uncultured Xanthomonas sp.]